LVNNRRNSECAMKLDQLDWSRWFTDHSFGMAYGMVYLHVSGPDESWQRVYCRHTDQPRLKFEHGQLYWIIPDDPGVPK